MHVVCEDARMFRLDSMMDVESVAAGGAGGDKLSYSLSMIPEYVDPVLGLS